MKGWGFIIIISLAMWIVLFGIISSLSPATIALPYYPQWPVKIMEVERLGITYWQGINGGSLILKVTV